MKPTLFLIGMILSALGITLGITRKTLNERIQNDTWKKLEIEKINRL